MGKIDGAQSVLAKLIFGFSQRIDPLGWDKSGNTYYLFDGTFPTHPPDRPLTRLFPR